jgi:phage-related protein
MALKPVVWVGSALDDLRRFPDAARQRAGYNLHLVQLGGDPADWKPMPSVGTGVVELRIRTDRAHRVFYIARFGEGIYVLHAFEKKSQKTARRDVEIGRARLRDVIAMRRPQRRNQE